MNRLYERLCEITVDNLHAYDPLAELHFETSKGLQYSVFNYPEEKLLEIQGVENFIYECFFKILDRDVDEMNLNRYKKALTSGKLTKKGLIKALSNTNERKIKMTGLKA